MHVKALVVRKNQNTYKEMYVPKAIELNIPYHRRITSGGTFYHNRRVVNFFLIKSIAKPILGKVLFFYMD